MTAIVRAWLHVQLNSTDEEACHRFYVETFGLREVMRTESLPVEDGTPFAIDGPMRSNTFFLYDVRGPRTTVGIEAQLWQTPAVHGEAYPNITHPGFQAVGLRVPDLDPVLAVAETNGGTILRVVNEAVLADGGTRTAWLRDPDGILVEVVEAPGLDAPSNLHRHVLSTADFAASLAFYETLGFTRVSIEKGVKAGAWAPEVPDNATADTAVLTLPGGGYSLLVIGWVDPVPQGRAYSSGNHRGLFRCALATDDIDAAMAQLSAGEQKIEYRGPYEFAMTGTKLPNLRVLFLTDPDGVTVEVVHRPM
ncbi:VOC family protein [Nocardia nova]|uniref:VOC family protein n=1 Tax=Nocardia nova TaxID=37330 RepID=UPI0011B079D9|nr:VOC family protein [Nocardia nova]